MRVRLQKLLAEAGLGSRRKCEELITAGRVSVGDQVATLGATVDPEEDQVYVDGQPVAIQAKEYWLLNKPLGVLSAVVDARGRPTVTDLVPTEARVFPVGRLDLNSTGLVLLTNDGLLMERLLHPRYHVEKEYVVRVRGSVSDSDLDRMRRGVKLEGVVTSPATVTRTSHTRLGDGYVSTVSVTIREGRKRQVRRMLDALGHTVIALHRTRFASLTDEGLALGQVRRLTDGEVRQLRAVAGLL